MELARPSGGCIMNGRQARRHLTARRVLLGVAAAEVAIGAAWFWFSYLAGHSPTGSTRALLGVGIMAPALAGHTLTELRLLRESIPLSIACSVASIGLFLAVAYLATMTGLFLSAALCLCLVNPLVVSDAASWLTMLDVGRRLRARLIRAAR